LVFQTVLTHGPLTRAEVGRRTGLSPGAVTKAATPLLDDDWIVELGRPPGDRLAGRPATLVAVRAERASFLGVKVTADELFGVLTDLTARPIATRRAALDSGDISHAQKAAEPLRSETTPWIAEWVLMSKARKLQSSKLPAAIQVAKWNVQLYPDSFFAHYLLADLLLQDHKLTEALAADQQSLKLEPHNAAASNLEEKIQALQKPLQFAPQGTYEIKLKNDQSGDLQTIVVKLDRSQEGQWSGKKIESGSAPSPLRSVSAGANRLWLIVDGPFGPLELRITVTAAALDGYWAGPFGHSGHLSGSKSQ